MDDWAIERQRCVRELDVDGMMALAPHQWPRQVVMIGLHLSRYKCSQLSFKDRMESAEFVTAAGFPVYKELLIS